MGLFSSIFGGGGTSVTTTSKQNITVKPSTTVNTDVVVDTEGLGEGIAQGVASLGESISQGIADQQDQINIVIDTVDEVLNNRIFNLVLMGGLIVGYFYFKKKGYLKRVSKIQLSKGSNLAGLLDYKPKI